MALTEPAAAALGDYCHILWDWNTKINLTRHTDFEKFVARDLIDCVQLASFLEPKEKVLDVGSGGGVPGLVLAILRPDLQVTVCESVAKKAMVLEDIIEKTGLNVAHAHARAEEVLQWSETRFSTLTVRAVAKMKKLLGWLNPHWNQFDRLLLIKGPAWVEERAEARHFGHSASRSRSANWRNTRSMERIRKALYCRFARRPGWGVSRGRPRRRVCPRLAF